MLNCIMGIGKTLTIPLEFCVCFIKRSMSVKATSCLGTTTTTTRRRTGTRTRGKGERKKRKKRKKKLSEPGGTFDRYLYSQKHAYN